MTGSFTTFDITIGMMVIVKNNNNIKKKKKKKKTYNIHDVFVSFMIQTLETQNLKVTLVSLTAGSLSIDSKKTLEF